ncbi:MAG: class I SAM-dependent RNA methyltransferase [Alphaproteobacteria bacterium]|nr:class I SAM-dependent RNA methyltransferase [Alphaproteobacteria bacterium]
MAECIFNDLCGGCSFRNLDISDYQRQKQENLQKILRPLSDQNFIFEKPVFIGDGNRRRASMAFEMKKGKLVLGFNAKHSNEISDIEHCIMLSPQINKALPFIRKLVSEICAQRIATTTKKKKVVYTTVEKGDIWITQADNGLDLVLEFSESVTLDMREIVFEKLSAQDQIIRVSHRRSPSEQPEVIMEKIKPFITISGYEVYIPAGTFLQPSKAGENSLIDIVKKYLGEVSGKVADLFCGVGTFSYSLAGKKGVKIVAVDCSSELLAGFQASINKQMLSNIEIINRNLFKYPLSGDELNGFFAIVFDPPRSGAMTQVEAIVKLSEEQRPQKLVAVSCNPNTFVRDAKTLIDGGYRLKKITMVDQFVYSLHSELVALFEKN